MAAGGAGAVLLLLRDAGADEADRAPRRAGGHPGQATRRAQRPRGSCRCSGRRSRTSRPASRRSSRFCPKRRTWATCCAASRRWRRSRTSRSAVSARSRSRPRRFTRSGPSGSSSRARITTSGPSSIASAASRASSTWARWRSSRQGHPDTVGHHPGVLHRDDFRPGRANPPNHRRRTKKGAPAKKAAPAQKTE